MLEVITSNDLLNTTAMGGSSVRQGGHVPPPPQFLEANVKSLIFTIGPPLPDL